MKTFSRYAPLYFILTYIFLGLWLYVGVSRHFSFCLAGTDPANFLGLAAGLFGIAAFAAYWRHSVREVRFFGAIALVFGVMPLIAVAYRFIATAHAGCPLT